MLYDGVVDVGWVCGCGECCVMGLWKWWMSYDGGCGGGCRMGLWMW